MRVDRLHKSMASMTNVYASMAMPMCGSISLIFSTIFPLQPLLMDRLVFFFLFLFFTKLDQI